VLFLRSHDPQHPSPGAQTHARGSKARAAYLGTGHHPRPDQRAVQKLLKKFGSTELVRAASEGQLAMVFGRAAAKKVRAHYVAEAPQV